MNEYPQNRPLWNDTDIEAGEVASFDPGQASHKAKCRETIPFGVFVQRESGTAGIKKMNNNPTTLFMMGISLISNTAKNYGEREYLAGEIADVGIRGNFAVKVDPLDPPDPTIIGTGNIFVSYEAGKEGWIKGSSTNARAVNGITEGIEIRRVGTETVDVYLMGKPVMTA